MKNYFYILILLVFSSCTDQSEEKWLHEITYAKINASSSFETIDYFLQEEEIINFAAFRASVLSYPFDLVGEDALGIEARAKVNNGICDSAISD